MGKIYTEQLAEWVRRQSPQARHDRHRLAFICVRDDVKKALDQGWPVKTIWAHLVEQQRIEIGYHMFLIYVKRHLRPVVEHVPGRGTQARASPPGENIPMPIKSMESQPSRRDGHARNGNDLIPRFTFNPVPNLEELI